MVRRQAASIGWYLEADAGEVMNPFSEKTAAWYRKSMEAKVELQ